MSSSNKSGQDTHSSKELGSGNSEKRRFEIMGKSHWWSKLLTSSKRAAPGDADTGKSGSVVAQPSGGSAAGDAGTAGDDNIGAQLQDGAGDGGSAAGDAGTVGDDYIGAQLQDGAGDGGSAAGDAGTVGDDYIGAQLQDGAGDGRKGPRRETSATLSLREKGLIKAPKPRNWKFFFACALNPAPPRADADDASSVVSEGLFNWEQGIYDKFSSGLSNKFSLWFIVLVFVLYSIFLRPMRYKFPLLGLLVVSFGFIVIVCAIAYACVQPNSIAGVKLWGFWSAVFSTPAFSFFVRGFAAYLESQVWIWLILIVLNGALLLCGVSCIILGVCCLKGSAAMCSFIQGIYG